MYIPNQILTMINMKANVQKLIENGALQTMCAGITISILSMLPLATHIFVLLSLVGVASIFVGKSMLIEIKNTFSVLLIKGTVLKTQVKQTLKPLASNSSVQAMSLIGIITLLTLVVTDTDPFGTLFIGLGFVAFLAGGIIIASFPQVQSFGIGIAKAVKDEAWKAKVDEEVTIIDL